MRGSMTPNLDGIGMLCIPTDGDAWKNNGRAQRWHAARGRRPMWVIAKRPSDWPDHFVARLCVTLPFPRPTRRLCAHSTFAGLVDALPAGLSFLPRDPADDPVIVGVLM